MQTQPENLIMKMYHYFFGYKYYAIISNRIGGFHVGIHENIFTSKKEAKHHLDGNGMFQLMEIISFRSRELYGINEDGEQTIL